MIDNETFRSTHLTKVDHISQFVSSKYSWPYYSSYLAGSGYYSGLDTTATSGDWTLRRKWDLEDKMSSIQRMTDDLKLNNYRMLKDLKSVKSAIDL